MDRLKKPLNLLAVSAGHETVAGLSLITNTYSWSGHRRGGNPKTGISSLKQSVKTNSSEESKIGNFPEQGYSLPKQNYRILQQKISVGRESCESQEISFSLHKQAKGNPEYMVRESLIVQTFEEESFTA